MSFLDLFEKFLKNYEEAKGTWIAINWCIAILIFIIGLNKGYGLGVVAISIFVFGSILNIGMYFLFRSVRQHLMCLEGEEKERARNILWKFMCKKAGINDK